MIHIPFPSLSLNSDDFAPRDHYHLQRNYVIPSIHQDGPRSSNPGISMTRLKDIILTTVEEMGHVNLVINAHGMCDPEGVALGSGMSSASIEEGGFGDLAGRIRMIYICACEVAQTPEGVTFCYDLARLTQAPVIASEVPQTSGWGDLEFEWSWAMARMPNDVIDEFEGTTWMFQPDGTRSRFTHTAEASTSGMPYSGCGSDFGAAVGPLPGRADR
ncbi:MAG: hypothetical protein QM776_07445 [Rhodocyclaceae bacterium]